MITPTNSGSPSISLLTTALLATSFFIGLIQYNNTHAHEANTPAVQTTTAQVPPVPQAESVQTKPEITYVITPGESFGNITVTGAFF